MYSNVAEGARKAPSATTCRAFSTFHRATAAVHSPAISESAMILARASSPRLVSWVAVAVMPCGHSLARFCILPWNAARERGPAAGLPPTSLRASCRW